MKGEIVGHVSGVYVAPKETGTFVTEKVARLRLNMAGIPGDKHSGITRKSGVRESKLYPKGTVIRNNRQLSLVGDEEMDEISEGLGVNHVDPETIGANISTIGIPKLSQLPPYTRLMFERGAAVVVSGENKPCVIAGQEVSNRHSSVTPPDFVAAALGRRGVLGFVERAGVIQPDDEIQVVLPIQRYYSLPTPSQES